MLWRFWPFQVTPGLVAIVVQLLVLGASMLPFEWLGPPPEWVFWLGVAVRLDIVPWLFGLLWVLLDPDTWNADHE
jgi:hypothetical protein